MCNDAPYFINECLHLLRRTRITLIEPLFLKWSVLWTVKFVIHRWGYLKSHVNLSMSGAQSLCMVDWVFDNFRKYLPNYFEFRRLFTVGHSASYLSICGGSKRFLLFLSTSMKKCRKENVSKWSCAQPDAAAQIVSRV